MKIGFIEPVYKETIVAYNRHMKRAIKELRKYLPVWDNPSLGLLTAAAMVPDNWEIKYIDSYVDEIDYDEEFDIVAVSGMTRQAEDMYRIAKRFRKKKVYTVIGGIHATVLPDEAQKYSDTLIVGEAEDTFSRFLHDFSENKAKSVYYPENEVDMTTSPLPRFDLLRKNYGAYTIQTSRGCPHNCKFCAATRIFGARYRHKTVDQVVEEVKFLQSVKDNPFIIFVDDNMFVNKSFSSELMERLIPLKIKWHALTDVSVGSNKDFLMLLSKAGCRELFIGFESLNPQSINDINKSSWKAKQIGQYRSHIKNIQDCGIRIFGSFILGFDNDTREDFERIKEFVQENKIIGEFPILTPLPGTELYDEFVKSNRLLPNRTWKYFNFNDCVIRHPHFSAEELEKSIAELYRVTYSQENFARVLSNLIKAYKKLNFN